MTALPDTLMPDGPLRRQRDIPAHYPEVHTDTTLRRAVLRFAAVVSIMAAGGLWLVPAVPGDALMQLSKMAFSALLALGGVAMLSATVGQAGPEVQIDTVGRSLTIIERDALGHVRSEQSHSVDGLRDIVLRDHMLTARDAQGYPLFALPVSDPTVEAALQRMLAQSNA